MRRNYQNKVVWITGASEGTGRALAKVFAGEKAKLVLSARSTDSLERVAESCRKIGAASVTIVPFDLENDQAVDEACRNALALFGTIDLLLLNAGVSQRAFVRETAIGTFERLMKINYLSNVRITINVLELLVKNQGQIAVVSSLVGKFGSPYRSGYSASKHALHGFFDSLRAEHNENLAISIICPGFINTQLSMHALKGDGGALNVMDDAQARGMPAEVFDKKALAAIRAGKAEINIGGKERWAVYLKRFFPGFFRRLISKAKVR
jgi:dehydrogenase/reductase SDR family protein 7B